MPLRIGEAFAGYRVLRLLGSGGMGEVYLVQHPRLPRQEALKVLRADLSNDDSFRERFIREADLAAGLGHPHIVGVHDRGEHEGHLWIAMDYIDGTDVSQLLAQKYPAGMPIGLAMRIVSSVGSALDYAHKKGLLHRDVKPANIVVAELNSDESNVHLADFGIARQLDDVSGITTTNMTVGTVAYAAPEQLMGEPMDGRADQYALAATTYHLLTGSQLFPNSNPAVVISRHLNAPIPALAGIRPELASLDPVLAASLAKNPNERFASCADFARALTETTDPKSSSLGIAPTKPAPTARRSQVPPSVSDTDDTSPARAPSSNFRTRWLVVGSTAALLLVVVVGMLWRPWQHQQSTTTAMTSSAAQTTSITTGEPPATAPTAAPPREPNPAAEAQFVADVHANIPTASIPGGRPTDTRLVAYGYQACSMMDRYPNPASAAAPFYEAVSREMGYTRDPATITANEVWFMTIAAQYLCDAPALAPLPPVTASAAPTTSTTKPPSGPTIGDECSDWMKFSTDPLSGQEMLCSGYSENLNRGEPMKWYSAEKGAVGPSDGAADLPRVGRLGSSCAGEVGFTMGRSSDGYMVWCEGGGPYDKPGTEPVWAKYHP